jgi:hypothetical protein
MPDWWTPQDMAVISVIYTSCWAFAVLVWFVALWLERRKEK